MAFSSLKQFHTTPSVNHVEAAVVSVDSLDDSVAVEELEEVGEILL